MDLQELLLGLKPRINYPRPGYLDAFKNKGPEYSAAEQMAAVVGGLSGGQNNPGSRQGPATAGFGGQPAPPSPGAMPPGAGGMAGGSTPGPVMGQPNGAGPSSFGGGPPGQGGPPAQLMQKWNPAPESAAEPAGGVTKFWEVGPDGMPHALVPLNEMPREEKQAYIQALAQIQGEVSPEGRPQA